jgi:hypothetical protein
MHLAPVVVGGSVGGLVFVGVVNGSVVLSVGPQSLQVFLQLVFNQLSV